MRRFSICSIIALLIAAGSLASPNRADDRLQWFRNDKFGMFIHWGPYSLLAGEWKGQRVPAGSEAEWIMQRFNIPVAEYREMAHSMNPVQFNANNWVSLAKSAGMRYLVITAKHHDGFAMYHSRVSRYNIMDWTPFGRDPLAELSAACGQMASGSASTIRTAKIGKTLTAMATTGTMTDQRRILSVIWNVSQFPR